MASEAESFKQKGNECYTQKDYWKAIDWYTKAIDASPDVAAYYGNRAAALIAVNKFKDALEDSLTSIRLDPGFTKGLMRVGKCYLQFGDYDSSEKYYKLALAKEPNNEQIKSELNMVAALRSKTRLGEDALHDGDVDRAMQLFTSVLVSVPDSLSAKRGIAACQLKKRNPTRALELVREVLSIDPNDEIAQIVRAEGLYYNGNVDMAIKICLQMLEMDPDSSKIRGLLRRAREVTKEKEAGDKLFKERNYSEAAEAYTRALEVDPLLDNLNAKIYCNRAGCYQALKQYEEAVTDCNQAILLDEKYSKAYIRRAKCHSVLGNAQDSVYDWQKAKELDPENREISTGLREAQRALKLAQRKDYYKLLDISKDAGPEEIKRGYRAQAKLWHPDKHNETPEKYAEAEQRFKDITEANTVLSDPKAKRRYDNGEDLEDEPQMGGGFPPEMFNMFFGGGGGFGGFPGGGFHGGGFPGSSGGRRGRQASPFDSFGHFDN